MKGLPSTYNKDLQESVEPLIDCVKTVLFSIEISRRVISTLTIYPDKMFNALEPGMLATDLADYLVKKSVPFREAHHISGEVVKLSDGKGIPMDRLSHEDLAGVDKRLGPDFVFSYERSVEARAAKGGTSIESVREQIEILKGLAGGSL